MPLVFVYGTLKRGLRLHDILQSYGAKPRSFDAHTVDRFLLDVSPSRPFPYLYQVPKGWDPAWGAPAQIKGEVYKCKHTLINVLDYVEGVPHHYDRAKIKVVAKDSRGHARVLEAETYLAQHLPRPHREFSDVFQPQSATEDYVVDF